MQAMGEPVHAMLAIKEMAVFVQISMLVWVFLVLSGRHVQICLRLRATRHQEELVHVMWVIQEMAQRAQILMPVSAFLVTPTLSVKISQLLPSTHQLDELVPVTQGILAME